MAQNPGGKPLDGRRLEVDGAAMAANGDYLADDFTEWHQRVERRNAIATRENMLARNLNDAMDGELAIAEVEDDLAGLEPLR